MGEQTETRLNHRSAVCKFPPELKRKTQLRRPRSIIMARAMANKGSATALIIIGVILQGIIALFFVYLAIDIAMATDPTRYWGFLMPQLTPEGIAIVHAQGLTMVGYFGFIAILALVFMLLWYEWVRNPKDHKRGFKITGILGIILMGLLPVFILGLSILGYHDYLFIFEYHDYYGIILFAGFIPGLLVTLVSDSMIKT